MRLFDPQRPTTNSRPMWQDGMVAIPRLNIFPCENGLVEISCMLPIKDGAFSAKEFHVKIPLNELEKLISNFKFNPEQTLKDLFKDEIQNSFDVNYHPCFEPKDAQFARDLRRRRQQEERQNDDEPKSKQELVL